jgi:hypothetical protein
MLPIQFTYLFGSSLFFIPWFFIFFKRKDLRRILLFNGLLLTVLGLFLEFFYWTKDWWSPHTITNTQVGIEDIFLGFGSGGVAASLYLYIFNKKFITEKFISKNRVHTLILIIIAIAIFFFVLVYLVKISSFNATVIIGFVISIILLFFNKTLIKAAIINSILLLALVVPIYQLMIFVTPNFIDKTWMIHNLIGIRILGVPFEDYVFYFLSGIGCFLIYPYLFENTKLTNI